MNTNTPTKPSLTSTICKQCDSTIKPTANLYKGFDCSFCSNYCRTIFSTQIVKKDYSLMRHGLWLTHTK